VFANMGPPSYQVNIPPQREPVYLFAAPIFLSLAMATGGLWLVQGRRFQPGTRRILLLLGVGGLAVGYSSWWLWKSRGGVVDGPNFAAWVAVSMPCLWVPFSAVVLIGSMRSFRRTVSFLFFVPTFTLLGGLMIIELDPPLWLLGIFLGSVVGFFFGAAVGEGPSERQLNAFIETTMRDELTRPDPPRE
jgi:hypothetical protein